MKELGLSGFLLELQQRFPRPQLNFSVLDCPPISFLSEFHRRVCVTVTSQAVVGTLHPAGRPVHFKWLIYCSLSMWEVMENRWGIWAQRQFMLALHCSRLIVMQIFQLHSFTCWNKVNFNSPVPHGFRNDPTCHFPQYRPDWLINWLIKIYSKRSFIDLECCSPWRPPTLLLLQYFSLLQPETSNFK